MSEFNDFASRPPKRPLPPYPLERTVIHNLQDQELQDIPAYPLERTVIRRPINIIKKIVDRALNQDPLAIFYPDKNTGSAKLYDLDAERQKRRSQS